MTRRRLLVWSENYWVGGCDRFLVDLMGGLRDWPVDVELAGNPHPEFDAWLSSRVAWAMPRTVVPIANLVRTPLHRLDGVLGRDGAPTFEVGRARSDGPTVRTVAAALRYGQAAWNLQRLTRLMRRLSPDAVLINNGGYPGAESCRMATLAARRAGVKRVVHFVHNMARAPAWPVAVEDALDRRIDGAVDLWVTAAHRASTRLAEVRALSADRIATIHYGIPDVGVRGGGDRVLRGELGFRDGRPNLAVVANLEPRKGLPVLIDALARLARRGVMLPTAIVGEGAQRPALIAQIADRGLGETVRLLGWRDDVPAILAEADALALPSLADECLPYVILEAMAQRLPVISTDVAGIPEMVVEGKTGRVLVPGDSTQLAAALDELTADPLAAARMGEQGRLRVRERFGLEAMVARMGDALELVTT